MSHVVNQRMPPDNDGSAIESRVSGYCAWKKSAKACAFGVPTPVTLSQPSAFSSPEIGAE
jgi:hypothetical protein